MPYISVKTSASLSQEQNESLKGKLGNAISILAGKSESWLMVSLEDNCKMWFKGQNSATITFAEVKSFGTINPQQADKLTAEICEIISDVTGAAQNQTYVRYEETTLWGYNGSNF